MDLLFPISILYNALWLLILPILLHIEARLDRYGLKSIFSIIWALGLNFLLGYELMNFEGDQTFSPNFQGTMKRTSIEFKMTRTIYGLVFLVSILFTAIMFYSWRYMRWETLLDDGGAYKLYYYFLMFTSLLGFQVVLYSNDAFLLFFGWELMVVPGYALISIRPTRHAARAGISYAMISSIGSIFLLYGVALIYQLTGTFNLTIASSEISAMQLETDISPILAVVTIIVGIGVTAGLIGLQTWIPDSYSAATSPVGAFVSGTFTLAALIGYKKLIFDLFPFVNYSWIFILGGLATMTIGNFGGIVQRDVRRILAYSSIGQRGYILFGLGIIAGGIYKGVDFFSLKDPFIVVIIFGIAFTFLEGNLFLIIGKVLYVSHFKSRTRDIVKLRGSLAKTPHTALMMIISSFGLAGLPPTIGFSSKLLLLYAVGKSGVQWWIITIFLGNSVVALIYYLKLIRFLLFTKREDPLDMSLTPNSVNIAILFVSTICVVLGLMPNIIIFLLQG